MSKKLKITPSKWEKSALASAATYLYEALHDMRLNNINGPNAKFCGHDFCCVCPETKAKRALSIVEEVEGEE